MGDEEGRYLLVSCFKGRERWNTSWVVVLVVASWDGGGEGKGFEWAWEMGGVRKGWDWEGSAWELFCSSGNGTGIVWLRSFIGTLEEGGYIVKRPV